MSTIKFDSKPWNSLIVPHYLTTPWESIDCKFDSTKCSPTILAVISSQPMDFSISTLNSVRSRWLIRTQFSTPISFPELLVIVLELLSHFLTNHTPVAPARIPQKVQHTNFLSMTVMFEPSTYVHFIRIHLLFLQKSGRIPTESRWNHGGIQAGSRRNHGRIQTESGRNSNGNFWRILWGYAKFRLEKLKKHHIWIYFGCWWLLFPVFNFSGQNSWWIPSEKQMNCICSQHSKM